MDGWWDCDALDEFFFRVIRAAFGERRKTLANALAAGLHRPRPEMEDALRAAALDPRIRGERLTLEDFRRLADLLAMSPNVVNEREGAGA